jgi:hypothetical protein
MHPRTIAILVGSVLAVSLVLRAVIYHAGLLPLSEEIVLKKATSLTVTYTAGQPKTLTITDPEQLADLFSVLELHAPDRGQEPIDRQQFVAGQGSGGPVTFHFPSGRPRTLFFASPNWLGQSEVNPRFYASLCAYISRAEGGRRIDLFVDNDPAKAEKAGEQ